MNTARAYRTIEDLEEDASMIRGYVIHAYSYIEMLMNNVVKMFTFSSIAEYEQYMDLIRPGTELDNDLRTELFFFCVNKFERKHGKVFANMEQTKESLKECKAKRDIMAHWLVDTSSEAVSEYNREDRIKFYVPDTEKSFYCSVEAAKRFQNNVLFPTRRAIADVQLVMRTRETGVEWQKMRN
jgi:hypothetical protein